MTATREILGNVPAWLVAAFYVTVTLACLAAAAGFILRARERKRGQPDAPRHEANRTAWQKVGSVVAYLTFHKQLRRDRYAGSAHMLMFYGFFILFLGTCIVAAEDYGAKAFRVPHGERLFFYGWFYKVSSLVVDLGGVAFLLGLAMFLYRRISRATPGAGRIFRGWWVDAVSWLLLAIGVTGFLLEGTRIARDLPGFEKWSVVGYAAALVLRGAGLSGDASLPWHRALWMGHAALCIAFFALLPWKFFSHMTYGAMSWANRTRRPRAMLKPPPAPDRAPGAVTFTDLGWNDLLQADACTTCGRCNAVCPAAAAGKPLRPREVVLGVRRAMDEERNENVQSPGMAMPGLWAFVSDAELWSCTTCGACNEACPVGIEVYDKIIEMRRGRVEAGVVPDPAEKVFESSAERFNPYGKPASERMSWASGINIPVAKDDEPIDLLYWIGCAGSFDPDGQGVAKSMVKVLNHLGINYRVLGKKERCTGDPARRMGEEGLFEELVGHNLATFRAHGVTKILTHCPHCFNTFKNEYPQLVAAAGEKVAFEVEHHTQFLARQIGAGRLRLNGTTIEAPHGDARLRESRTITFHDPCYLGRGNGETQAPRDVLLSLPQAGMVEMERHGRESFCCGAGGGAMWLDVKGTDRVENIRAREAAATGAATIATGCPFCKSMLDAGVQTLEGKAMEVKDLAELVVEAHGL